MRKSEWIAGLVYLGVLVALAVAGHQARSGAPACAQDGSKIERLYRVRVSGRDGREEVFCCVQCAENWLGRAKAEPRAVSVTDETSGEEVSAEKAYFVRSLVVTNPTTGNRIHAFRDEADAQEHARTCNGVMLAASARPFAGAACPCCPECPER